MYKIDSTKVLGMLIRATRREQGLTQEQLAATSGVGLRFLRELEHGKETCQLEKTIRVVQMLGIELFGVKRADLPI